MTISKPVPATGTQQSDKSDGVGGREISDKANTAIAVAAAKAKAFNEQQAAENAAAGNGTIWPNS